MQLGRGPKKGKSGLLGGPWRKEGVRYILGCTLTGEEAGEFLMPSSANASRTLAECLSRSLLVGNPKAGW